MPKMKTHRGADKRLKKTAKGKLKRQKAGRSHLLGKKSSKRKRDLRKQTLVNGSDRKQVKKLLSGF